MRSFLLESLSFVFKRYKQQTPGIDKFYAVKHKMYVNRLVVLKIAMPGYYFDIRKKIWNEEFKRKFCNESVCVREHNIWSNEMLQS